METIKPLNNISFSSIFSAFNKAFEDYEMQLNKDELHTMLGRRGFVPELSFGAFENEKLIAFALNGNVCFDITRIFVRTVGILIWFLLYSYGKDFLANNT